MKRENMPLRILKIFLREPSMRRPAAEIILLTGFTKPAVYRGIGELVRYDLLKKQNRNYFINPEITGRLQSQKKSMIKNLTEGKTNEQ